MNREQAEAIAATMALLKTAETAVGELKLPNAAVFRFVTMTLSYTLQGSVQTLPPLTMTAAEAHTLALQLLDVADRAENRKTSRH